MKTISEMKFIKKYESEYEHHPLILFAVLLRGLIYCTFTWNPLLKDFWFQIRILWKLSPANLLFLSLLRNNSETGKIWSKQVGLREHFGSDKFLTCSSDMAKFFAQIVCSERRNIHHLLWLRNEMDTRIITHFFFTYLQVLSEQQNTNHINKKSFL